MEAAVAQAVATLEAPRVAGNPRPSCIRGIQSQHTSIDCTSSRIGVRRTFYRWGHNYLVPSGHQRSRCQSTADSFSMIRGRACLGRLACIGIRRPAQRERGTLLTHRNTRCHHLITLVGFVPRASKQLPGTEC